MGEGMTILQGLIQGLIQGITEFLPISSSGHLSVYNALFGGEGGGSLFFSLMLHIGTLAAVIAAFYEDLWAMIKEVGVMIGELVRGEFRLSTRNANRQMLYMLFIACLPMVLVLPLRKVISGITADKDIVLEGIFFLVTAGLLFAGSKARRGKAGINKMKPKHALAVGTMQAVAAFPGISRSGSTISTGLVLGFDREFMVKFSFLLGIPSILGGAVTEIGDAAKQGLDVPVAPLIVGMLAAAVAGYACIFLVRWLVLGDKFIIFAWYTLILGAVVIVVGIIRHLMGIGGADPSPSVAALANFTWLFNGAAH